MRYWGAMRVPACLLPPLLGACSIVQPSDALYLCDGGTTAQIDRAPRHVQITLSTGESGRLPRIPSTSGVRYRRDTLDWFETGDAAFLVRKGEAASCRLIRRG
ncbi:Membrane-bound lysozyme-inhibitor of c-type lysozyme [Jannaschia aquimarina]|nr:Membrane-bound lysozyme-inhibitor of c-type lysozyme [Jannaschia aquimarina]